MEALDRMPGDAEAAGAAAGMREVYGCPHAYAVGDEFWFQTAPSISPQPGRVVELLPAGRMRVQDTDGAVHTITPDLVAEF